MPNLAKNWLQYAQNRVARPTCIINSVLELAIVVMPIDNAHHESMHYACTFCSCARMASYVEVKVIDSICPSCTIMQMQGALELP